MAAFFFSLICFPPPKLKDSSADNLILIFPDPLFCWKLGSGLTNSRGSSTNFIDSFCLFLKFFIPIFFQTTILNHALPPQFFLISHRTDVFRESSFSWYCCEIEASILVLLQAPYYAIGLSKTFAIEFDNVIAEVEKSILATSTSLDAIIFLVHSSSLRQ